MLRKFYSVMLVSLAFAMTTTIFSSADTHVNRENKAYVVGYDVSKKEEIFGNLSDDQISQILAENTSALRKADESGNLIMEEKNIENKGLFSLILDDNVKLKEVNIVNVSNSPKTIGDVAYAGEVTYMVELNSLDNGWTLGEYTSTIRGICNSYNNTAHITHLKTVKTGRLPFVHLNGGVSSESINGTRDQIQSSLFEGFRSLNIYYIVFEMDNDRTHYIHSDAELLQSRLPFSFSILNSNEFFSICANKAIFLLRSSHILSFTDVGSIAGFLPLFA
ncbi:MAG: hypothetical protein Q4A75_05865 [Peptostreptococcaceae bacterium]|nr:hypothetical protein [Peptostreptococcaceae bacterium]